MTIEGEPKQKIIKDFAPKEGDTGSPEVQIAIWSERIKYLTEHMKMHPKDYHSRLGLLKLVSKRRSMLDYLKKINLGRYQIIIKALGLRR